MPDVFDFSFQVTLDGLARTLGTRCHRNMDGLLKLMIAGHALK